MNMDDVITYGRAFKSGDVVLLRAKRPMSAQQMSIVCQHVRDAFDATGIRFIVIPSDFDIVEKSEETK